MLCGGRITPSGAPVRPVGNGRVALYPVSPQGEDESGLDYSKAWPRPSAKKLHFSPSLQKLFQDPREIIFEGPIGKKAIEKVLEREISLGEPLRGSKPAIPIEFLFAEARRLAQLYGIPIWSLFQGLRDYLTHAGFTVLETVAGDPQGTTVASSGGNAAIQEGMRIAMEVKISKKSGTKEDIIKLEEGARTAWEMGQVEEYTTMGSAILTIRDRNRFGAGKNLKMYNFARQARERVILLEIQENTTLPELLSAGPEELFKLMNEAARNHDPERLKNLFYLFERFLNWETFGLIFEKGEMAVLAVMLHLWNRGRVLRLQDVLHFRTFEARFNEALQTTDEREVDYILSALYYLAQMHPKYHDFLRQVALGSGFLPEVAAKAQLVLDRLVAEESFSSGEDTAVTSRTPHRRAGPKIGPNEPCHCGSGKKFKRCCGEN